MTKTHCHNGTLPFWDYGDVHADDGGQVQAFMPFFMISRLDWTLRQCRVPVEPLCWRWIGSPPASRPRRSPIWPTYGPLSMSKRCALLRSRIVCSTPSRHDCSPGGLSVTVKLATNLVNILYKSFLTAACPNMCQWMLRARPANRPAEWGALDTAFTWRPPGSAAAGTNRGRRYGCPPAAAPPRR